MQGKGNKAEARWRAAQRKERGFWERPDVLDSQVERVVCRYLPVIREVSASLDADARVLDVGCGPTCTARYFEAGSKTYLDPLMESYRRAYAATLPQAGKVCGRAEMIPAADDTFDVVISVNALDHMHDPGEVLAEVRRVLAPDGVFLLGIFLHAPAVAVGRRLIDRFLPFAREDAHPYSYTLAGMRALLSDYFVIDRQLLVFRKETALAPALHRRDWIFFCKK
ncbi:MAG: class I SAM-dependent methyltransferase [Acidobacteriota bacterium]